MTHLGIALGIYDMLTTSTGNVYGDDFENYMNSYSEWLYKKKKNRQKDAGRENMMLKIIGMRNGCTAT